MFVVVFFFSEFLWAAMERLRNVQSRGVPLLFYSPSSRREKGKTGEAVGSEKRNE